MKTGVTYYGSRRVEHVIKDLKEIKKNHCNAVLHCLTEEDVSFNLESMKKIVAVSHDMGFQVYNNAWAYCGVFGGVGYSGFTIHNLDACQVDNHGNILPAACLNHPKFRAYMKKWVDAVVYIGGDIAFWDEPHFYIPSVDCWWFQDKSLLNSKTSLSCCCDRCQELFESKFNHKMPQEETKETIKFRHYSMIDFFEELTSYAKKSGLKNNVCVIPQHISNQDSTGTGNGKDIAAIKDVDEISTDPYWRSEASVEDVEKSYRNASRLLYTIAKEYKKEAQIWIPHAFIRKGKEDRVRYAYRATYEEGIRNIFTWSYKTPNNSACDDPDLVWKILGEEYKKMHKK